MPALPNNSANHENFIHKIMRLMRTVAYIPADAILWRLFARSARYYYQSPLYGLSGVWKHPETTLPSWVGVEIIPGCAKRGVQLANGHWKLAGKDEALGLPPRQWCPTRLQALQVFELHYHEWLADLFAANRPEEARMLVADWLTQFSHYHPIAWHAYPLSLRVVSWLTYGRWLLLDADDAFREAFSRILITQIRHLRRNCEWDLGGNHLLKNLKALLLGGVALNDADLTLWAEQQFVKALNHQVLPDGSHDERTPHYQAQVLQDVLELRAALRNHGAAGGAWWDEMATKLGTALAFHLYPDGHTGLWNDSILGDANRLARLVRESGAKAPPSLLPAGGYARLELKDFGLLFDAGKVGPDENPGHAHADTLAFELWWGTQRVVVNQGTLAYQHAKRGQLRATAAHSTVAMEGHDSAEVWGGFRVGRRPRTVALQELQPGREVRGSHDGYRHLGIHHSRQLRLMQQGSDQTAQRLLHGTDELAGKGVGKYRAFARFHLHPAIRVQQESPTTALLSLPDGRKLRFTCEGGTLMLQPSLYAPQFNQAEPTQQLAVRFSGAKLDWGFTTV